MKAAVFLFFLLLCQPAQAATITFTLPDETLEGIVREFRSFHKIPDGDENQIMKEIGDFIITTISLGNYKGMDGLGMSVEVSHD